MWVNTSILRIDPQCWAAHQARTEDSTLNPTGAGASVICVGAMLICVGARPFAGRCKGSLIYGLSRPWPSCLADRTVNLGVRTDQDHQAQRTKDARDNNLKRAVA